MNQKTIFTPASKVNIGSMKHRITVSVRTITPALGGALDATQNFSSEKTVYAAIKTLGKGEDIFAGTSTIGTATHIFYIRALSGLTAEKTLVYKSDRYDILSVQDLQENQRFHALYCSLEGTTENKINFG